MILHKIKCIISGINLFIWRFEEYYRLKIFKDMEIRKNDLRNFKHAVFSISIIIFIIILMVGVFQMQKTYNKNCLVEKMEKQRMFGEKIVVEAEKIKQLKPKYREGFRTKEFLDCSNFVSLVFDEVYMNDIRPENGTGNGVKQIYDFCLKNNYFHENCPKTGDLVFFSRTLNVNGKSSLDENNRFKHIGIVEFVMKTENAFIFINQAEHCLVDAKGNSIFTKTDIIVSKSNKWIGITDNYGYIEGFATIPYNIKPKDMPN